MTLRYVRMDDRDVREAAERIAEAIATLMAAGADPGRRPQ